VRFMVSVVESTVLVSTSRGRSRVRFVMGVVESTVLVSTSGSRSRVRFMMSVVELTVLVGGGWTGHGNGNSSGWLVCFSFCYWKGSSICGGDQ
jgi:hypothetical protein